MACFLAIRFIRISSLSCWRYSFTYLSALLKISLRFCLRIFQKIKRSAKLQHINQSTATTRKLTLSLQSRSILNTFLIIVLHYFTHLVVHLNENMAAQVKQNSTINNASECKLVYYNGSICDWAK